MSSSKFALFVDLENCGAKVDTLLSVLEKVKIRGDILLGKVYGYTDQYSDLKEVLLSNTFTVVPSLRYGISQKNNADILLVIDALEVAFTNPLIDSFCIVSGDSDYTPLVGRLKSMGKFVLGISRSAAASNIFINACNEFQFLENVGGRTRKPTSKKKATADKEPLDEQELNKALCGILEEQTDKDELYASELKGILLRLRPDFNEKSYGCTTFLKLLDKLSKQFRRPAYPQRQFQCHGLPRAEQQGKRPGDEQGKLARPHPRAARPLQGGRLRTHQPQHPQGRYPGQLPRLFRKGAGIQALQRHAQGHGKGRPDYRGAG